MMDDASIQIEKDHRRMERICIILDGESRSPTPFELNLAMRESNEWEALWRAARPEDREP